MYNLSVAQHSAFYINCSDDFNSWQLPQPSSRIFLNSLRAGYAVTSIIAVVSTFLIFTLAALHFYFIYHFVSSRSRRVPLYWLLGLFPVSSACFLASMLMPRTANFLFPIAWIYLMLCLLILIETVKRIFGGRAEMSRLLIESNQCITFRVPPCCCCCKCFPLVFPSEKNLRRVEWLVLQTVVVRIVITIVGIVLLSEMQDDIDRFITIFTYMSAIQSLSLMFAIFGCHILMALSKKRLSSFRLMAFFRIIEASMGLFGLQDLICNVLVQFDVFSCGPVLSKRAKSNYWYAFVMICGLTLLSCLTTYLFHPRKSEIFDRHPSRIAVQRSDAAPTVKDQHSAL